MDILIIAIESGRGGPARLPQNLGRMGLRVATLCPADNPLAHTDHAVRKFDLPLSRNWRNLRNAIEQALVATGARLVIPTDEQVVALLHFLVRRDLFRDKAARAVVIASLGDPAQYPATLFKSRTLDLARTLALPTPRGATASGIAEACAIAADLGFPVIAKKSFSWAGMGVVRCDNADAVARTLAPRRLARLRRLARAALGRSWYPDDNTWEIQQMLDGYPAMYAALAWRGQLLGGYAAIPIDVSGEFGPSTAVTLLHDDALEAISAAMIKATGLSGFVGFDFMMRRSDDAAMLIECNPRPIQITHLGFRVGVDLAALLADVLLRARLPAHPLRPTTRLDVALFPARPHDTDDTLYHDLPGADQGLLAYWRSRIEATILPREAAGAA